jgi:hypothetical protein
MRYKDTPAGCTSQSPLADGDGNTAKVYYIQFYYLIIDRITGSPITSHDLLDHIGSLSTPPYSFFVSLIISSSDNHHHHHLSSSSLSAPGSRPWLHLEVPTPLHILYESYLLYGYCCIKYDS